MAGTQYVSVSIRTLSAANWFKQEECVDRPIKSGNHSKFDWDLGGCFMTSPGIGPLLNNHLLFCPAFLTTTQWWKLLQDSFHPLPHPRLSLPSPPAPLLPVPLTPLLFL